MTSWAKTTGAYSASTCIFVALIGLSCGAPPLDVSEFFGSPASSPEEAAPVVPESKIRSAGSTDLSGLEDLLAKLGGKFYLDFSAISLECYPRVSLLTNGISF